MKIRIIGNKPKRSNDGDISHLIGQEFRVKESDEAGVYIGYGDTSLYLIHPNEYEVIKEGE